MSRRPQTSPLVSKSLAFLLVAGMLVTIAAGLWGRVSRSLDRSARASTNAAFTPGNLVVYRVGDGSGALSAAAAPVFLDEYTPAGALVQTIPMPTLVSGANKRLTAAGNSTSEGFLTRSADGNYLILAGYDAAVATGAVAGTTSAATNRVIGRLDVAATVDTSTALTDAISGGNPRGATSTNGTDLWISGTSSGGGVRYATLGATSSTSLAAAPTNIRAVNIFGGQLYISSAAAGFHGVATVGTGTPSTAGQTITRLAGFTDTNSPSGYGFVFLDDPAVAFVGFDTLYVADDTTAGVEGALQKWTTSDGINWTRQYRALSGTAAFRGLTGQYVGANLSLFGTTTDNRLVSIQDTGTTFNFTTLTTGALNTAFRGVAFTPAPATPTLSVSDFTANETDAGTTTFTFNVNLSSPAPAGGVTFDIATADGTAQDGNPGTEDNDYVAKTETGRTIAAGNSTTTFTVTVNGDTTPEANETFFVNVTNVSAGAIAGDTQGLGTITNDDNVTPTLNIGDVTQAETNAGTTTFNFNVSLTSPAPAGGVSFTVNTADGTTNPANSGSDYVAITGGSGSITSGNTSTTVSVTVNGDTTPEANETFFVNISGITGATSGDVQGLGTITNDDVILTPIHTIQGSGSTSPIVSTVVTTTGIVTGVKSNGFFIQDPAPDADPNTSEGIFVFTSSTPPAAAALGNLVQVGGTIQEFIPSADPASPPTTELVTPTVSIISTGNSPPAAITITAAETTQASETSNPLDSLEEYEGMRVTVLSLTVSGPSQGTITEPSATVASSGVFLGVVTGVARPFREAGIAISDPLPGGAPVTVPRFDENPERIRVDSDALTGTTAIDVAAGTVVTNITGPLDFAFRTYTIDPDLATPPSVGAQPGSTAAPVPTADEFTVVSFNMERFFDTTDAPGISDAVLTPAAFNRRLAKASLIIRTIQRYPDVIGVQEMENLSTLQAVATQVNSDAVSIDALPNPNYTAYLVEGNDVGGIDVGFLVKQSRISVVDVTQAELPGCDHVTATTCNNYINPNNSQPEILNDRPPLILRATCPRPLGGSLPFTVIVNHMRSLSNVDDATDGNRVRTKRRAGGEFLANLIQARQTGDPTELLITLGDLNAFAVNDGYVDVIGTIKGTPAPASQVTLASSDLVNPDLYDMVDYLPAAQQYSYNFDGNAQTLDHIILNKKAFVFLTRFAYARNDSDFAVKNYELTNELRISDHDQPVAYFNLALAPTATNGNISGHISDNNGNPVEGAAIRLSGTQNRLAVTDSYGNYNFENVETTGVYTVTPSRANFSFSPSLRSLTLSGQHTEAAFTASRSGAANPLDRTEYFVRQQYVDFLGREPDEAGLNFWVNNIESCGANAGCREVKRRDTSAAFFISIEFQQTGYFVDLMYKSAFGDLPGTSVPLTLAEFRPDAQGIGQGVVVNQIGWEQRLAANKESFATNFVQRPRFASAYATSMTPDAFVDRLFLNAGITPAAMDRAAAVSEFGLATNTSDELARGRALRRVAENSTLAAKEFNRAFVLMQYFGYLRRDPNASPDGNFSGYDFWLNKLENFNGNYADAEMVQAFLLAGEYRGRFSQ